MRQRLNSKRRGTPWLIRIAAAFCLLVVHGASGSESTPLGSADAPVRAEFIEQRLAEVSLSNADETIRNEATELYRRALANIETAQAHREAAARYFKQREQAAVEAEELLRRSAARTVEPAAISTGVGPGASAQEIQLLYQREQANAAAIKAKLAALDRQLQIEHERPLEVRERLPAATGELSRLGLEGTSQFIFDDASILAEARHWFTRSRAEALEAEIAMLDQAMLSQPQRLRLLQARRQETAASLERARVRTEQLKRRLNATRRAEATEIAAGADAQAIEPDASSDAVAELIQSNRAYAEEVLGLTAALEGVEDEREHVRRLLDDVEHLREQARATLLEAYTTPQVSHLLESERRVLGEIGQSRADLRARAETVAQAKLRGLRLADELRLTGEAPAYVERVLQSVPKPGTAGLRSAIERLVDGRLTLINKAAELNAEHLRSLETLEFEQERLQRESEEYINLLVQRLLWVRSKEWFGLNDLLALPRGLKQLLTLSNGTEIGRALLFPGHLPLLMLAVLAALLYGRKRQVLRDRLGATGSRVGRALQDDMTSTFKALGLSLVIATPWPLLAAAIGYSLSTLPYDAPVAYALGRSILRVAPGIFFLQLFRVLCLENGVADLHFGWPRPALEQARRQLVLLFATTIAAAMLALCNATLFSNSAGAALSQLLFAVPAFGVAWFVYGVFSPANGIASRLHRGLNSPRRRRWMTLWLALGLALPAGTGAMAIAGYIHSSGALTGKLIQTLWLLLGVIVINELVTRWLLLTRRRMLLAAAQQRREAAQAEKSSDRDRSAELEKAEESAVHIETLDADTRLLVRIVLVVSGVLGTFALWSELLPAFATFDSITLWHGSEIVDGVEQPVAVTLVDVVLAMFIAFMTWIATRTLPSALEIILRQRSGETLGSRLAFATLLRYGIVLIGVIWTLDILGTSWSKLQWIIAALGVGIGFGLQEIVANFISGIVILIERPVRVGDTITVGDATGKVTRIQIRATTLRNWDQQEILVPNKEFITQRVLNWSLSDENIRIFSTIGIAYGSDIVKALALIKEALDEHPLILSDPEPLVTFEGFGENALTLCLRCYIPSYTKRLETTTELNLAIEKKFRDAGIVIAWPQRDLHLDTARPLDIRLMRGSDDEGKGDGGIIN